MGSIPDFYVYILMRPNGRPFYIGKGSGDRIHKHEKEAEHGCECHKCRTIRKIWKSGHQITKSIVFSTRIEAEAYQLEARLIDTIGLHNLTNCVHGEYPFIGKVIKQSREHGLNAVEYRAILAYSKEPNIKGRIWQFHHDQLTALKKYRRYEPNLTPEELQHIDREIEALVVVLWPKSVEQLSLDLYTM